MSGWKCFDHYLIRDQKTGLSLDVSRMGFDPTFVREMEKAVDFAFTEMKKVEDGKIKNEDEGRQVGHYWLRDFEKAPNEKIRDELITTSKAIDDFVAEIHSGKRLSPSGKPFRHILQIGIGGSALGPQLVADALSGDDDRMTIHFLENTDPDGIDRCLENFGEEIAQTLTIVTSKSGGTKETRNGMVEAEAFYEKHGLNFAKHAVAVTGPGSLLSKKAEGRTLIKKAEKEGEQDEYSPVDKSKEWITQFPMTDWVGGRTSVTGVVGLLPAGLQGLDTKGFLHGARAMDEHTRKPSATENAAMLMALMWYHAGEGHGKKAMVVLPYKDRLLLLSKYLQQLVMESLGKELDRKGKVVNQGITVYGNKGSTDQHAYVQQLRDGLNNFFTVFIEVRRGRKGDSLEVEPDATSGDYLQGFLRGTRTALAENGRASMTLSIPDVSAKSLGALIALFERAVGLYAELIDINAYHQPGVEAGKKAATSFLNLLKSVRKELKSIGKAVSAEELAKEMKADPEEVFHCLTHLATNVDEITLTEGVRPSEDVFQYGL